MAVRCIGAALLISAVCVTTGCAPASEEKQVPADQLQSGNLFALWNEGEYHLLYTFLQDARASRSSLTRKENLYLGYSAYRVFETTGETEYLNQAVTALERFRLLTGSGNEQLSRQLEESREVLAAAYFLLGRYERALQHAEADFRIIAALSYFHLGEYEASYTAISTQNGYHEAIFAFLAAEAAGMMPEVYKSLEAAAGAAENEKELYTATVLLAEYAAGEGDFFQARTALESLQERLRDSFLLSSAAYTVSTLYRKQGMIIEAQAMIRRALEHNPDNSFAREWL